LKKKKVVAKMNVEPAEGENVREHRLIRILYTAFEKSKEEKDKILR